MINLLEQLQQLRLIGRRSPNREYFENRRNSSRVGDRRHFLRRFRAARRRGRGVVQPVFPFLEDRLPAAIRRALLLLIPFVCGPLLRAHPPAVALDVPKVPPGRIAGGIEVNGHREMGHRFRIQAVLLAPNTEVRMRLGQLAMIFEPGRVRGLGVAARPGTLLDFSCIFYLFGQPCPPLRVFGEFRGPARVGIDPLADLVDGFPSTAERDQSQQAPRRHILRVG